jgi:hypothetical protein
MKVKRQGGCSHRRMEQKWIAETPKVSTPDYPN